MFEEQQTHDPDTSEGTEEGQEDVQSDNSPDDSPAVDPEMEALKILSGITKREYKNLEDAQKHLDNLNKFVGDPNLRTNAELWEATVKQYANEQNITPKEARNQLQSLVKGQKEAKENVSSEIPDEFKTKLSNLERKSFLSDNPEAKPYIDKVQEYAEFKGMNLDEAWQTLYGDVVSAAQENSMLDDKRDAKKAAQVTASSSGTPAKGPSKHDQLMKKYTETADPAFLLEAIKAKNEGKI